jgi:protein-glutamine gamma-glutamyltransferase
MAAPHPLIPEQRPVGTRELAWLLGALALIMIPHALRAPWWLTGLVLCLYGWRVYFTLNRGPLPSRWLLLGVAVVGMVGIWVEGRTLFGRQAGIMLLMLFSGLKLLETRTHRDAAVAVFLGFFLIITNFLNSQSIPIAALMMAGLFMLAASLVGLSAPQRPLGRGGPRAGRVAARATRQRTRVVPPGQCAHAPASRSGRPRMLPTRARHCAEGCPDAE